jgi:hypothetical protein
MKWRRPCGASTDFCIRQVSDASGKLVKWYGLSTDIEGGNRSEEALKLARTQIVDGIQCARHCHDTAGEVELVNHFPSRT